jgi:hypothetical protein
VICCCPKSDFLQNKTKLSGCSVLDSVLILFKTWGKVVLFAWRDPAG